MYIDSARSQLNSFQEASGSKRIINLLHLLICLILNNIKDLWFSFLPVYLSKYSDRSIQTSIHNHQCSSQFPSSHRQEIHLRRSSCIRDKMDDFQFPCLSFGGGFSELKSCDRSIFFNLMEISMASHVTTTTGVLAVSVKKSSSVATGGSPYGAGVFVADGSREATKTELAFAEHRGNYVGAIVKRLAQP